MAIFLNDAWKDQMLSAIKNGNLVDETTATKVAIRFLIIALTNANRPFKLFNLGAGVQRLTTDTETCPCCKRKL